MKKVLLFCTLTFISISLFSQAYQVPKNYKLKSANDFKKYEKDVVKAVDWITNARVTNQLEKRMHANEFVLEWATNSPTVKVEINNDIVNFKKCQYCLLVFIGGWTKYSIGHNYSQDNVKCNMAGLNNVLKFYNKNAEGLGTINELERYKSMRDHDELEPFVKSILEGE